MNEEERSEEEIPHNSQQNLKTITTMFWLKAKFLFSKNREKRISTMKT